MSLPACLLRPGNGRQPHDRRRATLGGGTPGPPSLFDRNSGQRGSARGLISEMRVVATVPRIPILLRPFHVRPTQVRCAVTTPAVWPTVMLEMSRLRFVPVRGWDKRLRYTRAVSRPRSGEAPTK